MTGPALNSDADGPVLGDAAAADLLPHLYQELCAIASFQMRGERAEHTLQPTAVVHEAFIRLAQQRKETWDEPGQFLAVASMMIHRVLVDHARRRLALKRGGGRAREPLGDDEAFVRTDEGLVQLHEAMERLSGRHPRAARVVELRFFGGVSIDDASVVLGVSPETVKADWRFARAWLAEALAS